MASEGLISATDILQVGIFSAMHTPLSLLAKWLEGLLTKELCRALSLSTQPALHPHPLPPPPLVFPQKPSPSLHMGLNCSSWTVTSGGSFCSQSPEAPPLVWLAAVFRAATAFPHLPFPSSRPVCSFSSPPQLSSSQLPPHRKRIFL